VLDGTYNFNVERKKRDQGPKPINLVTFGFDVPVYASDRDITPAGGPAHLGLIKTWGFIDTNIVQTPGNGILGTIETADLQLTIVNTNNPRFSDNFSPSDPPENVTVYLYQWFAPLQYSEKQLVFKGIIVSPIKYDEYTCTLVIRGIFEKYNNKKIGSDKIIYADNYPDADPDEYGKMANIIYGNIKSVPCNAIVCGDVNNLVDDIDASQTTIELSDASYFPASGVVGCDTEEISYTGNTGTVLTGCTRGYNSTTASTHSQGAAVWEELAVFVYLIAAHPVNSISDIYCDGLRITAICTIYTGQPGNQLAGYEGTAVFTVPSRLTRQMAIDLLINDGLTINDATAVVDTIAVNDGISVSDTIAVSTGSHSHLSNVSGSVAWTFTSATDSPYSGHNPQYCIDGDSNTASNPIQGNTTTLVNASPPSPDGVPTAVLLQMTVNCYDQITFYFAGASLSANSGNVKTTYNSGWQNLDSSLQSWAALAATNGAVRLTSGNGSNNLCYEVSVLVKYSTSATQASPATGVAKSGSASKTGAVTKTGAASKSGTVTRSGAITLSGNSVADVRVGQLITANVQGYKDDANGTYTGTPNALIERPDAVFKHIWTVLLGAPLTDIDPVSFAAAGAFYAANTYKFAKLINSPIQATDLFMRLALQCRSRFVVTGAGIAKLFIRQCGQSSINSVIKNEIKTDSLSVQRSPVAEIINLFYIYYDLDITKSASDPASYNSALQFTDAASVALYGMQEWTGSADLFCFDAVNLDAMAQDVGNFLIGWHKRSRKMPTFGVFLDNMDINVGNNIDLTHPLDAMNGFIVEVLKLIYHLGSGSEKQIDWIEITGIENAS
jgi:hypothetical protein